MTKGVKIIAAAILILLIGSVIAVVIVFRPSDKNTVRILQDNKVLYTLDLSKEKDRTFRIEAANGGWNDITLKDGRICVSCADCPDQTCVNTGFLRSEGVPVVCLPHRLVIRFADEEKE